MKADARAMLSRVHALAVAAMASLATPPPPAAAELLSGCSRLEMAWLKSVGRVPGAPPPSGGWNRLAAAAGYRGRESTLAASTVAAGSAVGRRRGGSGVPGWQRGARRV